MKTQYGTSLTADFEKNTWTFLMDDGFTVEPGVFKISNSVVQERLTKETLLKSIRLQKYFDAYGDSLKKEEVFAKFTAVWGDTMGIHFLRKYASAESLILNLDADNLEKFILYF